MNIKGDKLILRALEIDDAPLLLELINDESIEKQLGGWSFPVSSKQQIDWLNALESTQSNLRCIIQDEDTNQAMGSIMLTEIDYKNGSAEIHIKISPQFHGLGVGKRAINALLSYCFNELRLNCIYSHIISYNEKSQRLFEKCGFEIEGVLRKRIYKNGKLNDVVVMSILK